MKLTFADELTRGIFLTLVEAAPTGQVRGTVLRRLDSLRNRGFARGSGRGGIFLTDLGQDMSDLCAGILADAIASGQQDLAVHIL